MASQTVGGYPLAGLGERFIAYIIDTVILSVIGLIVGFILGLVVGRGGGGSGIAGFVGLIIGIGYYIYFWSQNNGQTPGKSVMGIRVIKLDGSPITAGTALIRYIGYIINSLVIFIGWIWAFFDPQRQGWHDKIAGTVVVKAK